MEISQSEQLHLEISSLFENDDLMGALEVQLSNSDEPTDYEGWREGSRQFFTNNRHVFIPSEETDAYEQ